MHVQFSMPASLVSKVHSVPGTLTDLEEVRVVATNQEYVTNFEAIPLQTDAA